MLNGVWSHSIRHFIYQNYMEIFWCLMNVANSVLHSIFAKSTSLTPNCCNAKSSHTIFVITNIERFFVSLIFIHLICLFHEVCWNNEFVIWNIFDSSSISLKRFYYRQTHWTMNRLSVSIIFYRIMCFYECLFDNNWVWNNICFGHRNASLYLMLKLLIGSWTYWFWPKLMWKLIFFFES